jgi:hypothetical protein
MTQKAVARSGDPMVTKNVAMPDYRRMRGKIKTDVTTMT